MLPLQLELKNFLSHKESKVDFTQFNMALLVGSTDGNYNMSNGSGKSGLLDSILWVLFNKTRASSMDDVIMWGEQFCKVSLTFSHNNSTYMINRKRNRSAGTSLVEFLKQEEDGSWLDISGSTPTLTNERICSTIKIDPKTFTNSIYFRQNDISEFADADPSKKKEILKSMVDISKWDTFELKAKDELKKIKTELVFLQNKISELEPAQETLNKLEIEHKDLLNQISIDDLRLKNLDENFDSYTQKYNDLKNSLNTNKWDEVVKDISFINDKLKKLKDEKSKCEISLNSTKEKSKSLSEKISKIESSISIMEVDEFVKDKISSTRELLVDLKSKIKSDKDKLTEINNKPLAFERCTLCNQDISHELHERLSNEQIEKSSSLEKSINFNSNRVKEYEVKLRSLENIETNSIKLEKLKNLLTSDSSELERLKESILRLNNKLIEINNSISSNDEQLRINNDILNSLKNDDFKNLREEIKKIKEEREILSAKTLQLHKREGAISEKKIFLLEKVSSLKVTKNELKEKQKNISIYEKMIKYFGKNGIQTILLDSIISDLEKTSNEVLSFICNEPFVIYLDTQRTGSDGISTVDTLDLRVKKDGIAQNFKSLSGGEQFRVSLALRIALSEVASKHGGTSLDFLLLDEVDSPLDRQGKEQLFMSVIRSLEKKYKMLVITHSEYLKDKFDNILEVNKINGESTVNLVIA